MFYRRLENQIVCVTTNSSTVAMKEVSAKFDNQEVTSKLNFHYISNPVVYTVEPIRGITSGGVKIMVNGTNLEYVQQAQIVFRKTEGRKKRSVQEFYGVSLKQGWILLREQLKETLSISSIILCCGFFTVNVISLLSL